MERKQFTVGYVPGCKSKEESPFIKFGGNWLRDFNIDIGDKLELIQGKNMLVLMKVSKTD